jgi:hypothetical protein
MVSLGAKALVTREEREPNRAGEFASFLRMESQNREERLIEQHQEGGLRDEAQRDGDSDARGTKQFYFFAEIDFELFLRLLSLALTR